MIYAMKEMDWWPWLRWVFDDFPYFSIKTCCGYSLECLHKNIYSMYSLELPHLCHSYEYPQLRQSTPVYNTRKDIGSIQRKKAHRTQYVYGDKDIDTIYRETTLCFRFLKIHCMIGELCYYESKVK